MSRHHVWRDRYKAPATVTAPPLEAADVVPGVIAYLHAGTLHDDPAVSFSRPANRDILTGAFVCLSTDGASCSWTLLTQRERVERHRIATRDIRGSIADGAWFMSDGADVWTGPPSSFVRAASREWPIYGERPSISANGVAEMIAVTVAQRRARADGGGPVVVVTRRVR